MDATARGNGCGPFRVFAEELPAEDVEETLVGGRKTGVVELLAVEMVGDGSGVVGHSVVSVHRSENGRLHRQGFGFFAHFGGAFDLVPVEGSAVDGALDGLEQHDGEDLPVGEALQPDVEEQPAVALVGGVTAFEREGEGRGDEVDDEKGAGSRPAAFRSWPR